MDVTLPTNTSTEVPSVSVWLNQSMQLMKKIMPKMILLILGIYAFIFVAMLLGGGMVGGLAALGMKGAAVGLGIIGYILYIVGMLFISGVIAPAVLYIFASEGKISLTDAIKTAMPKALPILGLLFVMGILITGGSYLLLIPGILISLRFMFALQERVFFQTSMKEAFRASSKIFTQNAWEVIKRALVMIGLFIAGFLAYGLISNILFGKMPFIAGLLFMVLYVFAIFFAYTSSYLTYVHLRQHTNFEKSFSLKPMVIMAMIGLVIYVIFMAFSLGNMGRATKNAGYGQYNGTMTREQLEMIQNQIPPETQKELDKYMTEDQQQMLMEEVQKAQEARDNQ